MVASLFSNGQASMIGLQSTSIRPLPIAYITTLHIIPMKGSGKSSGKNASPTRPSEANISDATMQTRYPI